MFIQTYTGKKFNYSNITEEMVDIDDISQSLSMTPRYFGHTIKPYSVAEHCVKGAELLPKDVRLAFLLHDAAEAYIGDIASPLKALINAETNVLKNLETQIMHFVHKKFGVKLDLDGYSLVKYMDSQAIFNDSHQVFKTPPVNDWHLDFKRWDDVEYKVEFWNPEKAKSEFLSAFSRYGGKLNAKN